MVIQDYTSGVTVSKQVRKGGYEEEFLYRDAMYLNTYNYGRNTAPRGMPPPLCIVLGVLEQKGRFHIKVLMSSNAVSRLQAKIEIVYIS